MIITAVIPVNPLMKQVLNKSWLISAEEEKSGRIVGTAPGEDIVCWTIGTQGPIIDHQMVARALETRPWDWFVHPNGSWACISLELRQYCRPNFAWRNIPDGAGAVPV